MITVIPRKITATSVNGVAVANDGSITLPVDSTPTSNSTNLVTSGGVKTELDALTTGLAGKQNTLTFDSTPTSGSTNPVTSGGVYAALANGQNTPVAFGTCASAAAEQNKVVTVSDSNWQLKVGSIVGVKFSNSNTYSATAQNPCTLNVNSSGAKAVYYDTGVYTGTNADILGYNNRTNFYMYDGTYWIWLNTSYLDEGAVPSAYCTTDASTSTKAATCTNFTLAANSYVHILIQYANTYDGAVTLNINSTGAKPIYINGSASSSSNKTLPAGTYIIYYDGTNYYFRTDGMLPGSIEKVNGHTVEKDVPSNAVFTDTTYESKSAASGGTDVSLVTTGDKYNWNRKLDNTPMFPYETDASSSSEDYAAGDYIVVDPYGLVIVRSPIAIGDAISFRSNIAPVYPDEKGPINILKDGKVDKSQGTANAGKVLGIGNNGMVTPVPYISTDFTGATSFGAGTRGYVPAPGIEDYNRVLRGAGMWTDIPETGDEMPMSFNDGRSVKYAIDEISKFTLISGATKSSIQNNLVSFANVMLNDSIAAIQFEPYSNPAEAPFENTTYVGTLYKTGTKLFVRVQGNTGLQQDLNGYYNSQDQTWTWNSFNSEISDLNTRTSNVVTEIPLTIAASSWSSTSPYTYTWTDSRVLSDSSIEVDILNTSADTAVDYIDYAKSSGGGGIVFTANNAPTANINVVITITNAQAHAGSSIDADTVATDAVSGASNVDEALSTLSGNISTMVGKHSTDIVALKNDLGIVEEGDAATHTIAQGQYVIWQGALYTADAAITAGTTLAASGNDKNLTAVENGGLNVLNNNLNTVSSSTVAANTTNVNIIYENSVERCGKLVILRMQFNFKTTPTVGTAVNVGTIPSGYCPKEPLEIYGLGAGAAWKETDLASINIATDGSVSVTQRRTAQNNWVKFYIPYFI